MIRLCFIAIILFLFNFNSSLLAQPDSVSTHGTIKISKHRDSTYIKTFTNFHVYYNTPSADLTYKDFVLNNQQRKYMFRDVRDRVKITDTRPAGDNSKDGFDYTSYFQNNHFTKDIKMREQESDTVRLLVYVSDKGVVKFTDLAAMTTRGGVNYVYNNSPMKEFKEDVSHVKTQNAFKELIKDKWQPAVIAALKTHPSKRKKKYKIVNAYSEGILTIIYSSSSFPFEEH